MKNTQGTEGWEVTYDLLTYLRFKKGEEVGQVRGDLEGTGYMEGVEGKMKVLERVDKNDLCLEGTTH